MSNYKDLESPLLHKNSALNVYGIKQRDLADLFEPDNIKDGVSVRKVESWGGIQGVLEKLDVKVKDGIDTHAVTDISARQMEFGKNDPIVKPPDTIWSMIVEQFEDKVLQILSAASAVSLVIGIIEEGWATGWLEGVAIFVAVGIIVSVTAINNYMRDKQFRNLNSKREQRVVPVLRN
jgi:Ca2+ transporting ATPase